VTQRLLESVSLRHGRILIYVWAIEQDEQSKRTIPVPAQEGLYADADEERCSSGHGQDVFVPWVLSSDNARSKMPRTEQSQKIPPDAIRRYYHMFSKDELRGLVQSAAQELGLKVGPPPSNETEVKGTEGVQIVVSGWERSNYYIELRRWQR
jgi:tRNA (uracil-5-)-methyltransferase TRM9